MNRMWNREQDANRHKKNWLITEIISIEHDTCTRIFKPISWNNKCTDMYTHAHIKSEQQSTNEHSKSERTLDAMEQEVKSHQRSQITTVSTHKN